MGLVAFLLGAVWGSFLNVCIWRLPRGISLLRPRSFCPSCGAKIRAYDNIPLLSFFLLRGKCRACGTPISWRYPLVEALTAFLALLCYLAFPLGEALLYFLFCSALLVASFIDIDHRIIPDEISLGGTGAGVFFSLLEITVPLSDALFGIAVGAGGLLLVGGLYKALRKQEGIGGGDVKLMGMIGAFLGAKGVLFSLFSGSVMGAVFGLVMIWKRGADMKYQIPFGPFLSFGAFLYLFWGEPLFKVFSGI